MKPYVSIYQGHVLTELAKLPANHFHCIITSPPYWVGREYKGSQQASWEKETDSPLGCEASVGLYLNRIHEVCEEVRRVLKPNGVFYLNIGDTYQNGMLCGIPMRIAAEYAAASRLPFAPWSLAAMLPWLKRSTIPNGKGRPSCTVEYVLMLTRRNSRYYYDPMAVRCASTDGKSGSRLFRSSDLLRESLDSPHGLILNDQSRPLLQDVNPAGQKQDHFAAFTPKLVASLIRLSTCQLGCCRKCGSPLRRVVDKVRFATRPGRKSKIEGKSSDETGHRDRLRHTTSMTTIGWKGACRHHAKTYDYQTTYIFRNLIPCRVLDPFCGIGVAGLEAIRAGCSFTGIDISKSYCRTAHRSIVSLRNRLYP